MASRHHRPPHNNWFSKYDWLMLKKSVAAAAPMELLKQNMAAVASSSVSIVSNGYKLVGCGSAVPSLQVSNDDLAKVVDTSNEWISVRIRIRNQRVLTDELVHDAELYRTSWHLLDFLKDYIFG
ncbi:hypothetical protein ACSBR2_018172 [Camellia fascicularis]